MTCPKCGYCPHCQRSNEVRYRYEALGTPTIVACSKEEMGMKVDAYLKDLAKYDAHKAVFDSNKEQMASKLNEEV